MTTLPPNAHPAGRYNERQTAELLGVCTRTIKRWTQAGRLHAHGRIGGIFYKGNEINKLWQIEQ